MTTSPAPKQQHVDEASLESQVKEMYRKVANEPEGEFHFEMGRGLAERLGYPPEDLDQIPAAAIESFAGVGYYFGLADLKDGAKSLIPWNSPDPSCGFLAAGA